MTENAQYLSDWKKKLYENRNQEYSFIKFFGNLTYNLNPVSNENRMTNNIKFTKGLITKEELDKLNEGEPRNVSTNKIWVEGTRESFSIYFYDENYDEEIDINGPNLYLSVSYISSTNYYSYGLDKIKKTFYGLRYYKNVPIIYCLDTSIPLKYLILDGDKFLHTNNIEVAYKQSLQNFYFFKDNETVKMIKEYIDEVNRIAEEKRLKQLEEEKQQRLIKYSIIGGTILIILLILLFVFRKKTKKSKNYDLDDYADDYYEDDSEEY